MLCGLGANSTIPGWCVNALLVAEIVAYAEISYWGDSESSETIAAKMPATLWDFLQLTCRGIEA